jgi:hypothetical protein
MATLGQELTNEEQFLADFANGVYGGRRVWLTDSDFLSAVLLGTFGFFPVRTRVPWQDSMYCGSYSYRTCGEMDLWILAWKRGWKFVRPSRRPSVHIARPATGVRNRRIERAAAFRRRSAAKFER